jgi:hypothetical protein
MDFIGSTSERVITAHSTSVQEVFAKTIIIGWKHSDIGAESFFDLPCRAILPEAFIQKQQLNEGIFI